jgi:hemerythrin-like domain-containing protein
MLLATHWSVLDEFGDEHRTVIAAMEALMGALHGAADNGQARAASDCSPLLAQAEQFRHTFLVHRLREEDGLFPEVQKAISDATPEMGDVDRFFTGKGREDLRAHQEIDGYLRELTELLQCLAEAPVPDPQALEQARACTALAQELLRDHAAKEDSIIFPRMAAMLAADPRRNVERRLEALRR